MNKINFAIFASGAGSNAKRIIEHFNHHPYIKCALVVCNNPKAGVKHIAAESNIPLLMTDKTRFFKEDGYLPELQLHKIDYLILAGFLWKIPDVLIKNYEKKIINIHPSLLPKYGGKGMYGQFVHQGVIENKEEESGITIHLVDEQYDHGEHIFQAKCTVQPNDTPESLAEKIHTLEHKYYAPVIEKYIIDIKKFTN